MNLVLALVLCTTCADEAVDVWKHEGEIKLGTPVLVGETVFTYSKDGRYLYVNELKYVTYAHVRILGYLEISITSVKVVTRNEKRYLAVTGGRKFKSETTYFDEESLTKFCESLTKNQTFVMFNGHRNLKFIPVNSK